MTTAGATSPLIELRHRVPSEQGAVMELQLVARRLVQMAIAGDLAAIKEIHDRLDPPRYPSHETLALGQSGPSVPTRWDSLTPSETTILCRCPTVPRVWTWPAEGGAGAIARPQVAPSLQSWNPALHTGLILRVLGAEPPAQPRLVLEHAAMEPDRVHGEQEQRHERPERDGQSEHEV
jgi:hypothetical protein